MTKSRRHKWSHLLATGLLLAVFAFTSGKPSMQLSTIDWTGDWPHAQLGQ